MLNRFFCFRFYTGKDATVKPLTPPILSIMKDCNQCGKCCIKYGGGDLAVTDKEIDQWEQHNPEIFKYVKDTKIWFDPESGKRLDRCPFLVPEPKTNPIAPDKYTCSIYQHRPDDCRQYPTLINEMIRDECEMIEATDLHDSAKAQRKLDILMSDSRHRSNS